MVLTSSHRQDYVERGFSLNDTLLAENMQGQILIAQRLAKVHKLLCNDYLPHNVLVSREFITLKTTLKEKKNS